MKDYDRTVFMVLHALRGIPHKEIAIGAELSPATVRKIRIGPKYGGTRRPHLMTLWRLAEFAGLRLVPVPELQAKGIYKANAKDIREAEREQAPPEPKTKAA